MTIEFFDKARTHGSPVVAPPLAPPAPRTLLDVLAATIARCADRVAVDTEETTLTYRQLDDAARELAARLRELGAGPGDRVGIRVPSGTTDLYVAIVGVLAAGAAYVPVDADDPPARAATIWRNAGVCAVVGADLEIESVGPACGAGRAPGLDDDAWIIFTSGSTGEPKGVAVTHRSAAAFVDAEARLWSVDVHDRVLAGLSVGFDASCEEMWLAWRHGAALVPAPRCKVRSGAELGPWLVQHGVTVISTVPTLAALWDDDVLTGVRLLILGGEALPDGLGWRLAAGREVWNTYGPTEATVVTTASHVRPGKPVTIGWPLDGWDVAVVDERGERVPVGEAGELVIGGVGLGRYLDPRLDAERFAPLPGLDWPRAYRTGDVVRESVSGLEFVGRRDDQVKLGGRRLELGEVDAQLAGAPGVRAGAAAVRKTEGGNSLLVGYVVGDVDPAAVREHLAARLPAGIVPLIVVLEDMPSRSSGKVDRSALPWPPPAPAGAGAHDLTGTAAWLAERWTEQLGPLPMRLDSDFFSLGGSSLAAAKLVSVLRRSHPAIAVADVYNHRTLGALAERLDAIGRPAPESVADHAPHKRRWGIVQLAGVFALLTMVAPRWVIGLLAFNQWQGGIGPQIGWPAVIAGWLLFSTAPGRAAVVLIAQRVLLPRVRPGRYARNGWLGSRLWFLERLSELGRLNALAGTPLAPRYARICGTRLGKDARLGTLPPPGSMVTIGDGATVESDVDLHGWWVQGDELVIGELVIEAGARVGTRTMLMPGSVVGAGAEVEPGSLVDGHVPAGERWAGTPARRVGTAGELWREDAPPAPAHRRFWKAMFAVGMVFHGLLPIAAIIPGLVIVTQLINSGGTLGGVAVELIVEAPIIAATSVIAYALMIALAFRASGRLLRPGWHVDEGRVGWALWFGGALMASARVVLFPLYSSLFTAPWLRLAGIRVGHRTEVSTAVGVNRLVSFGEKSFAADDVVFAGARTRGGWLHLTEMEVGSRTFLGNGALLRAGTSVGDDSLVGVLTTPPVDGRDGTSWFGWPALELPRVPEKGDPARTTDPPRRLVLARAVMETIRLLLPSTVSIMLAAGVLLAANTIGTATNGWVLVAATPFLLLAAGFVAVALTCLTKWTLMGRYQRGEHPFWSFFVWRDEIVNTVQEQLAAAWLLNYALGTPLMSAYLRAMGARIGRDCWVETLTITEFDLVDIGDGCSINRRSCVETHLFHDRLMRIGPIALGRGVTMGPASAVLPDAKLGDGCSLAGRSVVLRGEELPAGTRWHGAPVSSM